MIVVSKKKNVICNKTTKKLSNPLPLEEIKESHSCLSHLTLTQPQMPAGTQTTEFVPNPALQPQGKGGHSAGPIWLAGS